MSHLTPGFSEELGSSFVNVMDAASTGSSGGVHSYEEEVEVEEVEFVEQEEEEEVEEEEEGSTGEEGQEELVSPKSPARPVATASHIASPPTHQQQLEPPEAEEGEKAVEDEEEEEGNVATNVPPVSGGPEVGTASASGPAITAPASPGTSAASRGLDTVGGGGTSSSAHESEAALTDAHGASSSHDVEGEDEEGAQLLPLSSSSGRSTPTKELRGAAGADYDFHQLENQAAKVAKEVQGVALDVSKKLTDGWKSALGASGLDAGANLTKFAGGLSTWWNSLDPIPAVVKNETAERIQGSNKASSELQEMFGLSAEENLVEQFKCKLLQTYACNHNAFTPAIQMAFQGTLYITDRHTAFSVEERGRKLPFKVQHSQVVKATRQRPQRRGDLSDILKLELSGGQFLSFKDFDSGGSLDSALALVEHLMEG